MDKTKKVKLVFLFAFLVCLCNGVFSQDLEFLANKIRAGSIEEKRDALFQLRNLESPEASRRAVSALQDTEEIIRVTAIYSVVYLPPEEAAQVLLPLLQDKLPFVRKETAYALGKVKNPIALTPLLQTLQKDKFSEVRMACAVVLGEIGEVSAIISLLDILHKKPKEEEDFLRRAAGRSIGQIAQMQQIKLNYVVTPESLLPEKFDVIVNLKHNNLAAQNPIFAQSIKVLISVLQNQKESDDVRREAAFALGAIGDESVIRALQENLNDKDYYLAEIAKEGLTKLNRSNR